MEHSGRLEHLAFLPLRKSGPSFRDDRPLPSTARYALEEFSGELIKHTIDASGSPHIQHVR